MQNNRATQLFLLNLIAYIITFCKCTHFYKTYHAMQFSFAFVLLKALFFEQTKKTSGHISKQNTLSMFFRNSCTFVLPDFKNSVKTLLCRI